MASGIYIVRLLNDELMPVTRDSRYTNMCAKVNRQHIKVGKALDFDLRRINYFKDFDEHNVIFEPIVQLKEIKSAETAILRELKQFRMLSPKGGRLEWLEGIAYESAREAIFCALKNAQINYTTI
jgi:hypothetical protein